MPSYNRPALEKLSSELLAELTGNILSFWQNRMADPAGGFYGRIDGHGNLHADADRGIIMYARILWAFSAAFNLLREERYLASARRAFDYILEHFLDREYGGMFWLVDSEGKLKDSKKQIYAQGFAIYGLSEYYRACGEQRALDEALALVGLVEKYAWDSDFGGYIEACTRDWQPNDDMRLSEKESNVPKSMNTHLHIIEPYTNLYRVHPSTELKERIMALTEIFRSHIFNAETGHFDLLFHRDWTPTGHDFSYGHEIEASWLLDEAAAVIGEDCGLIVQRVADSAAEGLQPDGSMAYEYDPVNRRLDAERHWWVQAEAMVGYFNLYQRTAEERYLNVVLQLWKYIKTNLIDRENGEWFWGVKPDGSVNRTGDKAGFWKCPYHNTRLCTEIMMRIVRIFESSPTSGLSLLAQV